MTATDHAVVLAAGMGRRLRPLTDDTPKTLLDVGGRPILGHIFDALADNDYRRVTLVVGHEADRIREFCANIDAFEVEYVENDDYAETNNLYSLWLARDALDGGFTLVNADTVFTPATLARLVDAEGSALVVDREKSLDTEEMTIAIENGILRDISKELDAADGEYIGLCKFDAADTDRLVAALDAVVAEGSLGEWYERAFADIFEDRDVGYVEPVGPWTEIDDAEDLAAGRERFRTTVPDTDRT